MCWFSPIIANKEITNAYSLSYSGLNLITFYVNLALQGAFGLPFAYFAAKKLGIEAAVNIILILL